MEGLRIELRGERFDGIRLDLEPPRAGTLADGEILEIEFVYTLSRPAKTFAPPL